MGRLSTMICLTGSLCDPTCLPPPQVAEEGGVSVNLIAEFLRHSPENPMAGSTLALGKADGRQARALATIVAKASRQGMVRFRRADAFYPAAALPLFSTGSAPPKARWNSPLCREISSE